MDKQSTGNTVNGNGNGAAGPSWWGPRHSAAWERTREAFRRDWEQTRSDFSVAGSVDLHQNVGDTVKQALGADPVPTRATMTRPDEPGEAAARLEKQMTERAKVDTEIASARSDMAVAQVEAEGKIAQERFDAQSKIARAEKKLGEIAADAREAIVEDQRKGQEKLAKQQGKIDAVRAETGQKIADVREKVDAQTAKHLGRIADATRAWEQIEPAMRYGYGARMEYASNHAWDDTVERRLQAGWADMKSDRSWDDARSHVRHGWESAHIVEKG